MVDEYYRRGWSGHFEATFPTIALHQGLEIEDFGGSGRFTKPGNTDRFYRNTPGEWGLWPGTFIYRPAMTLRPDGKIDRVVKVPWPLSKVWPFSERYKRTTRLDKLEPNKLWHPVKPR
jgi:hypothetical protein